MRAAVSLKAEHHVESEEEWSMGGDATVCMAVVIKPWEQTTLHPSGALRLCVW